MGTRNLSCVFASAKSFPILSVGLLAAALCVAADVSTPYPPGSAAESSADSIKETARPIVESSNREFRVTSEHRDNSPAHQRGAIDYRSNDVPSEQRHTEAAAVSRALGPNHTVVVEDVHLPAPGAQGPSAQTNTAFRNGVQGNERLGQDKATATHTHVQPEVLQRSEPTREPKDHRDVSPRDNASHDRPGEYRGHDLDTLDRLSRTG